MEIFSVALNKIVVRINKYEDIKSLMIEINRRNSLLGCWAKGSLGSSPKYEITEEVGSFETFGPIFNAYRLLRVTSEGTQFIQHYLEYKLENI